jgi:hypothetical protein
MCFKEQFSQFNLELFKTMIHLSYICWLLPAINPALKKARQEDSRGQKDLMSEKQDKNMIRQSNKRV